MTGKIGERVTAFASDGLQRAYACAVDMGIQEEFRVEIGVVVRALYRMAAVGAMQCPPLMDDLSGRFDGGMRRAFALVSAQPDSESKSDLRELLVEFCDRWGRLRDVAEQ